MKAHKREMTSYQPFVIVFWVLFAILSAGTTAQAGRSDGSPETVRLRLVRIYGADSFPEYRVVDEETKAMTQVRASLRCVERAYDGRAVWSYRELMIFDPKGPAVRRKEPRAEVAIERGYGFVFASHEECDGAMPTALEEPAHCDLMVELDRKKRSARLIHAACEPAF